MSRENPSIRDVAEEAGVSISTVSRIINDTDYPVSDELRRKVLEAIEKLNYYPNYAARNLRTKVSDTVGLIVRDISDPYYALIVEGVTKRAMEKKLLPIICNTGRRFKEELKYHELLWNYRVRAIILGGGGVEDATYRKQLRRQVHRLNSQGLQLVALAPQGIEEIPQISVDNKKVGYSVTEFLLTRGHSEIAYIGGPKNIITSQKRFEGYREALYSRNIDVQESVVEWSDFKWEGGYEAVSNLLDRQVRFTGIVSSNDEIAAGALMRLKEAGKEIPGDISLISIGDLHSVHRTEPPITTAHLPLKEMGRKGIEVITGDTRPEDIELDFYIVDRGSVKSI